MVPDQSDFHIFSSIDICVIYLFRSRSYHATPSWWLTLPLICPTGSIKSLIIYSTYSFLYCFYSKKWAKMANPWKNSNRGTVKRQNVLDSFEDSFFLKMCKILFVGYFWFTIFEDSFSISTVAKSYSSSCSLFWIFTEQSVKLQMWKFNRFISVDPNLISLSILF